MALQVDEDDTWGVISTSPIVSSAALGSSGGGCCYGNVIASPSSLYALPRRLATLYPGPGPARGALEREMYLGHGVDAPVDRRKKRMIKNRESASRSRARKHAHVTQVESEVHELRLENEQLRLKYEQLKASVEVPVPVKRTLQRVLSAPF